VGKSIEKAKKLVWGSAPVEGRGGNGSKNVGGRRLTVSIPTRKEKKGDPIPLKDNVMCRGEGQTVRWGGREKRSWNRILVLKVRRKTVPGAAQI